MRFSKTTINVLAFVCPGFMAAPALDATACGTVCGDGMVAGTEECDDGGTADGDGCSSLCQVEPGFTCPGEPSVCVPVDPATTPRTIYWAASATGTIERANLDGSNIQSIALAGTPRGIATDPAAGKVYWADIDPPHTIQRANHDGSAAEELVSGLFPWGIALDASSGKMYWTNPPDKIHRANLDGSVMELLVSGLSGVRYLALDPVGEKIYWTEEDSGSVRRANLDGSDAEGVVNGLDGLVNASGIAIDPVAGKVYWSDLGTSKIQRANVDGSSVEDLVSDVGVRELDLDLVARKIYWTQNDRIKRANLDGTLIEPVIAGGLASPRGIALDPCPLDGACNSVDPCPADLNGDGEVGPADLAALLGSWGQCDGCPADVDGDGEVGPTDLAMLLGAWGPCP